MIKTLLLLLIISTTQAREHSRATCKANIHRDNQTNQILIEIINADMHISINNHWNQCEYIDSYSDRYFFYECNDYRVLFTEHLKTLHYGGRIFRCEFKNDELRFPKSECEE